MFLEGMTDWLFYSWKMAVNYILMTLCTKHVFLSQMKIAEYVSNYLIIDLRKSDSRAIKNFL